MIPLAGPSALYVGMMWAAFPDLKPHVLSGDLWRGVNTVVLLYR